MKQSYSLIRVNYRTASIPGDEQEQVCMQGVSLNGRIDFMTPFAHTPQRGSDVIRDLNVWLLINNKK